MKVSAGILAAGIALASAGEASAAVLRAEAVNGFFSDFSITFSDANGDGRFDLSELTLFSGVVFDTLNNPVSLNQLLAVPAAFDFATLLPVTNPSWSELDLWRFGDGNGTFGDAQVASWSYRIETDPAVVPLPAGLPLLLAGLGALALLRRRGVAA